MSSNLPAPFRLAPRDFVHDNVETIKPVFSAYGLQYRDRQHAAGIARELLTDTHGKLTRSFTMEQRDAGRPYLRAMEFFDAIDLEPGRYQQLHTTGLKYPAMERSIRHLMAQSQLSGVTVDQLVYKTGQRPVNESIDGSVRQLMRQVRTYLPHPLAILLDGTGLHHEADLALAAMLVATDGQIELIEESIIPADSRLEVKGVPISRSNASCRLRLPNGSEILWINCPAVTKPEGGHRPPSAISVTEHFLAHYGLEGVTNVALRNGKTHGRVSRETQQLLRAAKPDLTFAVTCEATTDEEARNNNLDINAFGELLRTIAEADQAA